MWPSLNEKNKTHFTNFIKKANIGLHPPTYTTHKGLPKPIKEESSKYYWIYLLQTMYAVHHCRQCDSDKLSVVNCYQLRHNWYDVTHLAGRRDMQGGNSSARSGKVATLFNLLDWLWLQPAGRTASAHRPQASLSHSVGSSALRADAECPCVLCWVPSSWRDYERGSQDSASSLQRVREYQTLHSERSRVLSTIQCQTAEATCAGNVATSCLRSRTNRFCKHSWFWLKCQVTSSV